jgi:hypothetical protein
LGPPNFPGTLSEKIQDILNSESATPVSAPLKTVTEQMGQSSLGNGHRQERTKEAEDPQGSCCSLELWEKGTLRGTNSRIGTNGEKQDVQANLANVSERKHTLSVVDSKEGEELVRDGGGGGWSE